MKVRLAIDDFHLNGFLLISPLDGKNPIKIDQFVDDGECEEIILEDILDYVPTSQVMNYIKSLSAKLKHGGTLTICGKDIEILSEEFIRGDINIIDFNKLVFGLQNHAWNFKNNFITLNDLNEIFLSLGMKILQRELNGHNFIIKIERV